MRLSSSEWLRIGILAIVSLLVAGVLVFRGGDSDDPEAAPSGATPVAAGPSASTQLADAEATGAAVTEPADPDGDASEPEIVQRGEGTFTGALTGPVQYGTPSPENEVQFSVAVEDGIGVEATDLARIVDETLADPRSWAASPDYALVRVPTGGLFQLVVTSPDTTDDVCAPLQTIGQLSCAIDGVVAINLTRWLTGSRGWPESLDDYRAWVINHEVGHQLGEQHRPCPDVGEPAPVMQQQSIDLEECEANPWPFPDGYDGPVPEETTGDETDPADETGTDAES